MIYLIGGAPRSGKTTLAKQLSKKLGVAWVSTDSLESVVLEYVSVENVSMLFPKNNMRQQTKNSNDIMYTTYTASEIMRVYIAQGKTVHKAIESFIESAAVEGHDYILEGHHIHPNFVARMIKKYPKQKIKCLFLVKENVDEIVRGALKNKSKNDWFIQKTKDISTYKKIAAMLSLFGAYFKKEASKHGYQVLHMDTHFSTMVSKGVTLFTSKR